MFASVLARASVMLTEGYLRTPHTLKKYLERRDPHESVSAVVWLWGAQAWCADWLEDEFSVGAGLLFVACSVVGTWLGRRWFG